MSLFCCFHQYLCFTGDPSFCPLMFHVCLNFNLGRLSHEFFYFFQARQSHPVGTSSISPSSQESERNVPNSQEPKSKSQQVAKGNEGNVSDLDTSHGAEQASPTRSTRSKDALICHEDSIPTSDSYTESADSPFRPPDEIAKDEIAKNEFLRSPKRKR